ncbi:hypothetical protein PH5382_01472 [Phaeobacter sp. CECT 5382]|uniref:cupin domain-containing protein n=1 Tax=Phaeobacter sp. CECT 5382 TaxID=1712645 RepID=UPI0006DAAB01|nr:cupin domain-containing protein [Phaeobacter sp. CECT 5382]CUH87543.1 hypothetical protein PH5382_01472 [Phaeobacter sp. CECT 5382]
MDLFQLVDTSAVTPTTERPAPEKLVSGDPVFTTWDIEEREADGLYAGIWQSTPGAWRVSYDEWEYCRIREGQSVLKGSDGSEQVLKAGDSFLIRPGFEGIWEVIETTVKDYVIKV